MAERTLGGFPFEKLDVIRVTGAVSAAANESLVHRPLSPYGKMNVAIQAEGEGVYVESNDPLVSGYWFPTAEAAFEAHAVTHLNLVHLGGNLVVAAFRDGNDTYGKVRAGKQETSGAISWGTVANFNEANTNSISLCRVDGSTFALGYRDDGGSDYLAARIGTVNATTYAITLGTEKELTAAAIDDNGTGVALPRSGVLAFAYRLNSDTKGYVVAIDFSTVTFGTAGGTAVAFSAADAQHISLCSHDTGDIALAYQDGNAANDPIKIVAGTVSAAEAVAFGTAVSMAGTAAAATSCQIVALEVDVVCASWIDSTFPHVIVATISGTAVTKKTEKELDSTNACLAPSLTKLGRQEIAVVFEDDTHASDIGKVSYCTIAATTYAITAVSTNQFTAAATTIPKVCQVETPDEKAVAIVFSDTATDGRVIHGRWKDNMIDVRGSVASKRYTLWVTPVPDRDRKA